MLRPTALVIGFGSIGKRHANLLTALGYEVSVVSRRESVWPNQSKTVECAFAENYFDYVVVADETTRHWCSLVALAKEGYKGPVLVEKPLWEPGLPSLPTHDMQISVGYVLRYLPVLQEMRKRTVGRQIYSVEIRACSYLPDWRPDRDYRYCSSAYRSSGGGVLRDLSHELDYLLWIAGEWTSLSAVGGKLSQLQIDTEDAIIITGTCERAEMFCVSLNYIDRREERWIMVNSQDGTFRADLVTGEFFASGLPISLAVPSMDELYCEQHKDAASGNPQICCNLSEGEALLQMIAATELAISSKTWIQR